MNKNTIPGTVTLAETQTFVLGVLSLLCQAEGHTLSWYTSKKGRTWVALKENGSPAYSTSCEYGASLSEERTLDIFALLLREHVRKVLQISPPITSWLSGSHSQQEYKDAWNDLFKLTHDLYQHWQEAGATDEQTLLKLLLHAGIVLPPAPSQT